MRIHFHNNYTGPLLALIFLMALGVRLFFFGGIEYSDDLKYAYDAFELNQKPFRIVDSYWGVRTGLLVPLALSFRLFGFSLFSLVLYPLICSLSLIIVSFSLGKLFFSEKAGLLTAFLVALFPLDVEYATKVMPDVPVAFWMALGVLVFFTSFLPLRENAMWPGRRFCWFFTSGVIFGIAYLIRETGALMVLFIFLALGFDLVFNRPSQPLKKAIMQRLAICVSVGAGFMAVFCLEGIYYLATYGNFFQRYLVVTRFFSECGGIIQSLAFYPTSMLHLQSNWQFARGDIYYPFGFCYYAIFPALALALIMRFRETWLIALWFLFLFCYHQFGTMSLTHYVLIHRLARHLTVITVPALLILGYMLLELYTWKSRHRIVSSAGRLLAVILICLISLSSLWSIAKVNRYNRAMTYDAIGCYQIVREYPDTDVYADISIAMHLWLLDGYRNHGRFKPYQALEERKPGEKLIVILDSFRICIDDPDRFEKLIPPSYRNPGPTWIPLGEIEGPRYDVWARFNPRLYLIEKGSMPD